MPDRHDPKLSVRPLRDRRPDVEPSDDPLAELARIVTGRTPLDPGGTRGSDAPEDGDRSGDDLVDDLETELLNDLQASFAALNDPADTPSPPRPAPEAPREEVARQPNVFHAEPRRPPPIEPLDDGFSDVYGDSPEAEAPRQQEPVEPSLEQLLSDLAEADAEPAPRRTDVPGPSGFVDPEPEPEPEPPHDLDPERVPEPPHRFESDDEPETDFESGPSHDHRPTHAAVPPPPPPEFEEPPAFIAPRQLAFSRDDETEREPVAEEPGADDPQDVIPQDGFDDFSDPAPQAAVPPPPAEDSPDFSRLQLRRSPPPVAPGEGYDDPAGESEADEPDAVPQPPRRSMRERLKDAQQKGDRLSRFAPPRVAAAPDAEPVSEVAPEPEVAMAAGAGAGFDRDAEPRSDFPDEFSLDDLDTAAYAPEDDLPPFPEEELAGLKRKRSSRALAAVVGVLVIGLIGTAAFLFFGEDPDADSPPPIITADNTPTKIVPEDTGAAEPDQQNKLIYDRVDDGNGSETTLVTTGDDPIVDIPSDEEEVANNPISRVIIPGGPGIDDPAMEADDGANGNEVMAAETMAPSEETDPGLGPKKVRTVVVRPDGTIVSSEAVEEGAGAAPAEEDPAELAIANAANSTRTDMDDVLEGGDLPVNTDPLDAISDDGAIALPTPAPGTVPAGEEVAVVEEPVAVPEEPVAIPVPVAEPERATPPANNERTIVATTGDANGPIDLTPGSSGPQVQSGGALVQVSAQRSEEAARTTYRDLQARYPGILGPYQAAIIRADLGDRGVYYRVRIGPFSNSDAARLCEDLKAAGGDCLVAR